MKHTDPEAERAERKQRSERILSEAGIPINPNLPGIETAHEVVLRAPLDVAARAICTLLVAATCEMDRATLSFLIEDHGGAEHFTEAERSFLNCIPWPEDQVLQFGWRVEACWALLWALGYVDTFGLPTEQTRPWKCIEIVDGQTPETLSAQAKPRTVGEVLDQADLTYRCHWAVREAALRGKSVDALDEGVTLERRWALEWLIAGALDWDSIELHT